MTMLSDLRELIAFATADPIMGLGFTIGGAIVLSLIISRNTDDLKILLPTTALGMNALGIFISPVYQIVFILMGLATAFQGTKILSTVAELAKPVSGTFGELGEEAKHRADLTPLQRQIELIKADPELARLEMKGQYITKDLDLLRHKAEAWRIQNAIPDVLRRADVDRIRNYPEKERWKDAAFKIRNELGLVEAEAKGKLRRINQAQLTLPGLQEAKRIAEEKRYLDAVKRQMAIAGSTTTSAARELKELSDRTIRERLPSIPEKEIRRIIEEARRKKKK